MDLKAIIYSYSFSQFHSDAGGAEDIQGTLTPVIYQTKQVVNDSRQ